MVEDQLVCRVCGSREVLGRHRAQEMMYGTREEFGYFQCARCLCLQIDAIPNDLASYYGGGYYSYRPASNDPNPLKRWAARTRDRHAVFGSEGAVGRWLCRLSPAIEIGSLRRLDLRAGMRVMDVGCGAGELVHRLANVGVKRPVGIDPFILSEISYPNGATVQKRELSAMTDKWDVIMFHHSFEHLPDPLGVLRDVAKLLTDNGQCLIRVPTVTSYAWEHYGVDWVQLDAPRHLYLHAHESIEYLARAAGFVVEAVEHDGTDFQFWGSEQYRMRIPLIDERSHTRQPNVLFSKQKIREFRQRSSDLNASQRGDQAAFYLRKSPGTAG